MMSGNSMYQPNLRYCWICGSEYKYCSKCDKVNSWRIRACKPLHYQIIVILDEYRNEVLTDKEATEKFKTIGVTTNTDFSEYLPEVAKLIKTIISKGTTQSKQLKVEKSEITADK